MQNSQIVIALLTVASFLAEVAGQNPTNILPIDLRTRRFGQDWPTFLGPTGDSKSTETDIIKDWSNGLRIVWTAPITQSYGTCTVHRGRLFLFDSQRLGRSTNIGIVTCRNSETGEALWNYKYEYEYLDRYGYNNGPRNSPIVDGDRVYCYGVGGKLICLGAVDGDELWSVDTMKEFGVVQNFFGVGSNPAVVGDLLVTMVGGSPDPSARIDLAVGNGSGIVAYDKFDGKVAYRLSDQLASYASLKVFQSPSRWWCFAFMRGGLVGFDPTSGRQDFFFPWRARNPESVNASVPVVFDQHVFVSETYGPGSALLDFSKITGGKPRAAWQDEAESRNKAMQTHWNTAIYHEGYLYGSSGRHQNNAELRCIEAKTGKVMWTQPGLSRCSLLYADGHLICFSEVGELLLLQATPEAYRVITKTYFAKDGRPLLRPPAWAAPILSNGLLYLRGNDRLVCAELIRK